ncbi:MAG: TlyA family RNA methyltransferase [Phycisphaerae bacterium]|nr:TlyA family RNA methyltransferase [Phycisphaerales bacterium]
MSEHHPNPAEFVSRAGAKLQAALDQFAIDPSGWTCADLGCNTGGFTDCLLQSGASRVYAVDTGYGALAWKLRKDDRVVVLERTNALHLELPEPVDLVVIDVAWTRQHRILPAARKLLKPSAPIISLIKPHYEADPTLLTKGVLTPEAAAQVLEDTLRNLELAGFGAKGTIASPIVGRKGNVEYLTLFKPN